MESADAVLLKINDCLIRLQSIIKCGICCSTLRNPVAPNCNHAFCKECLDAVFKRRSSIECPICRQIIKKRSARTPSEHINLVVGNYLQLVQNFKREIKENNPLPLDRVILESQAITQIVEATPVRSTVFQEPFIMKRKKRKNEEKAPLNKKKARLEPVSFKLKEIKKEIVEESSESSITPPPFLLEGRIGNSTITVNIKQEPLDEEEIIKHFVEQEQMEENIQHISKENPIIPHFTQSIQREKNEKSEQNSRKNNPEMPSRRESIENELPVNKTPSPEVLSQPFHAEIEENEKINNQREGKSSSEVLNQINANEEIMVDQPKEEKKPIIFTKFTQREKSLISIYSSSQKITRNAKVGTDLLTFPMAIQCSLFPSDLDEAIKRQKMESPSITDISAFFSIFPTAKELFKANLPILLRELGMRPYFNSDQTDDRTMKFEIPITEEGSFLSDHDATIPMVNNSRISFGSVRRSFLPKSTLDSGCQTDSIEEKIEEGPKEKTSKMCQTDPIEPNINSDRSYLSAFEESKEISSIGCQTPRRRKRRSTHSSNKENISANYESEEDVFAEANCPTSHQEPQDFLIAISRRIGSEDNQLIKEFRKVCNVEVRSEISPGCTHLVMMDTEGPSAYKKPSIKYIYSIARRILIVKRQWLTDCLEAKRLLDTKEYLLGNQGTSQPSHSQSRSQAHMFLRKLRCYIPEKYFTHEEFLSRKDFVQMIRWCGGEISSNLTEFIAKKNNDDMEGKSSLIIFSTYCKNVKAAIFLSKDLQVPVVSADYILDSISKREILDISSYLLDQEK